ncbi:MAG: hypothetical protein HC821_01225 [Lewinella sp.]|nr:hypothetical protein [Lewinella sp.]
MKLPRQLGPIHFVGIGGIGMSGIAEVLVNLGYTVQGSDLAENANVKRLRDKGVSVAIGHAEANLGAAEVMVVSSAVKRDNPELVAARARFVPVVRRAEMLAELGYVALAIDMYGEGKTASHPEDAGKFAGMVMSNLPEAKARFEQALRTLKANPLVDGAHIAAIGYCFGGSVALAMANAGYDLDAVAAFHSGLDLPVMPSSETPVQAEILVANGAADPFISTESAAKFSQAMQAAGIQLEYIAYDQAMHAFTDPGADAKGKKFNLPLAYNETADRDSWQKLQALLDRAFTK